MKVFKTPFLKDEFDEVIYAFSFLFEPMRFIGKFGMLTSCDHKYLECMGTIHYGF